jgi:hypothetical protein
LARNTLGLAGRLRLRHRHLQRAGALGHQLLQVEAVLAQLLLRRLVRADVVVHAHHAHRAPGAVAEQHRVGLDMAHRAVGPYDAEGMVELAVAVQCAPQHRLGARLVFRVQGVAPQLQAVRRAGALHAEQTVHLLVPAHRAAGDVPVPDADAGRAGGDLQALFAGVHGLVAGFEQRDHLPQRGLQGFQFPAQPGARRRRGRVQAGLHIGREAPDGLHRLEHHVPQHEVQSGHQRQVQHQYHAGDGIAAPAQFVQQRGRRSVQRDGADILPGGPHDAPFLQQLRVLRGGAGAVQAAVAAAHQDVGPHAGRRHHAGVQAPVAQAAFHDGDDLRFVVVPHRQRRRRGQFIGAGGQVAAQLRPALRLFALVEIGGEGGQHQRHHRRHGHADQQRDRDLAPGAQSARAARRRLHQNSSRSPPAMRRVCCKTASRSCEAKGLRR